MLKGSQTGHGGSRSRGRAHHARYEQHSHSRQDLHFFEIQGLADTHLDVAAYCDGHTLTMNDNGDKVWAQGAVANNLDDAMDEVARRFALPVPIADVVYSSPHDAFIGRTTQGGLVEHETIDGIKCWKLDYDDAFVEVRLWIPESGQPLPRRLEIVYTTSPALPVSRIDFINWNMEAKVTDSVFVFLPKDGDRKIELVDFVEGMKAGAIPPIPEPAPAAAKAKQKAK